MILCLIYNGDIKHDCGNDNQEAWGCLTETKKAKWATPCVKCNATGRYKNNTCPDCHGQKSIPQARCPHSSLEGDIASANLLFKSFKSLTDNNILPNSGGMLEQSAYFVKGIDVINNYISLCNKVSEAKKEALAKLKRTP